MKIAIGGDHAGFAYKQKLKAFMESLGHTVEDFGPGSEESVDYPDHVHPLATSIEDGTNELGVLICGSANGVAMAANKHQGIRAAICWNKDLAALARGHNDANIVCIGARFLAYEYAEEIVHTFIDSEFEGGRHQRRVDKISC